MKTVLITGGTGMIGQALTKALVAKGYNVIILTRNVDAQKEKPQVRYAQWNVTTQAIDSRAIQQADYIVHLAGANVGEKRWTEKRKQEIIHSRVQSSALLVKALRENENKVRAVVSASAIGWYGPDPQVPNPHPFTEDMGAAADFLGTTCVQWEGSIKPVENLGKRLVILRTGIVLSNQGGAYAEFKKPICFGVAGVLGNGRQMVSWIHIDDLVNIYITAIEKEEWKGVYNAVAPQPVSNKILVEAIAHEYKKFHVTVAAPAFALKLVLGELSIEVLKSATVSNQRLEAAGYQFLFPTIEAAVRDLHKNASK